MNLEKNGLADQETLIAQWLEHPTSIWLGRPCVLFRLFLCPTFVTNEHFIFIVVVVLLLQSLVIVPPRTYSFRLQDSLNNLNYNMGTYVLAQSSLIDFYFPLFQIMIMSLRQ